MLNVLLLLLHVLHGPRRKSNSYSLYSCVRPYNTAF